LIKARNRKLSMLLVLAMLMTMFVGVGSASAAGTEFNTLSAPTITTDNYNPQKLGKVSIDIPDVRTFAQDGEWLTIDLPSGCSFAGSPGLTVVADSNIGIGGVIKTASDVVEVFVYGNYSGEKEGSILLSFDDILVKSSAADGDVVAQFLSNGATFGTLNTAVIAKIGDGATTVMAKSVKTIGDAGGELDTLVIAESKAGVFKEGETIELRLPKGFTWDSYGTVAGAWSLMGNTYSAWIDPDNERILEVYIDDKTSTGAAGRINIGVTGSFFTIDVADSANFGDVYVTVSSDKDSVEKQDVLVATYGDYGVKIVEDSKEDVDSGRSNQELGEFYIQESLPESLDAGRSLYFELPKGVEWARDDDGDICIDLEVESGTDIQDLAFKLSDNNRKLTVDFLFSGGERFSSSKAKILVKDMEVNIEPSFEGDIAVTVSGKAGAEGEAVVGTASRPVTLKGENPTKVEIGAMNQKAGDILIIENKDEAILDDEYNLITITLPKGVEFADDPTVEVEEGDLEIDDVEYYDDSLVIFIDAASSKASTIRISDVFLTVDRTVPEGDVVAIFEGNEVYKDNGQKYIDYWGSSALVNWATEESYGKVVIATTITPSQGGHAKFVIGSNIYEIGGIPYVMDAVPYIKDSRSYVPMRYLAQMIGAEIEWSEADQTVTLTKEGETEVVFTIGSTSYTVNGEAMTADVAPEIVNDRSFLPARFAAEAFGAQVGWDEATQTVIIIR